MSNIVTYLQLFDRWLLDRIFQEISNRIESKTGFTCFALGRLCIWFDIICATAYMLYEYQMFHEGTGLVYLAVFGFAVVILIGLLSKIERLMKDNAIAVNPLRAQWYLRLLTLAIAAFGAYKYYAWLDAGIRLDLPMVAVIGAAMILGYLSYFVGWYFSSCRPKPPNLFRNRDLVIGGT